MTDTELLTEEAAVEAVDEEEKVPPPLILSVRDWLLTCPLIDTGQAFRINFLREEPVAYSVDDVPGTPVLTQYFKSAVKIKNYVIATRDAYTQDVLASSMASGFFDDFAQWVQQQNKKRNFPAWEDPRNIQSVAITSNGYIFETATDTARYQMQLQITYYEKEEY